MDSRSATDTEAEGSTILIRSLGARSDDLIEAVRWAPTDHVTGMHTIAEDDGDG